MPPKSGGDVTVPPRDGVVVVAAPGPSEPLPGGRVEGAGIGAGSEKRIATVGAGAAADRSGHPKELRPVTGVVAPRRSVRAGRTATEEGAEGASAADDAADAPVQGRRWDGGPRAGVAGGGRAVRVARVRGAARAGRATRALSLGSARCVTRAKRAARARRPAQGALRPQAARQKAPAVAIAVAVHPIRHIRNIRPVAVKAARG